MIRIWNSRTSEEEAKPQSLSDIELAKALDIERVSLVLEEFFGGQIIWSNHLLSLWVK